MSNRILYSPGRIVFIQLILIIGFCVLIARLVYLQIYQDVFLADQVFERLDSNYSLLATRGKILDRNNKILALDVKGFSVGVDLSKFTNSQNQIDYLSKVGDNNIYGARPIKRKIQTQIENELSKLIISDDIVKGGSYTISIKDGRLASTLNQKQIQSNPSS